MSVDYTHCGFAVFVHDIPQWSASGCEMHTLVLFSLGTLHYSTNSSNRMSAIL